MNIGAIFARLLLAGALATGLLALAGPTGMLPSALTQEHEGEEERDGHSSSTGDGMEEIAEILRTAGFSEPHSVEEEHGVIEVKALGPDGRRYEIYIDPATGEILKQEEDD
jgi:uncharacterized membrane protein YkoI